LKKLNLTNLALALVKCQRYQESISFCDKALEVEHTYVKALFLKGRALCMQTEFTKAIEVFEDLVLHHPDNEEGKKELART
jgi:tetratricopeptide (TPR) repeat protein